MSPTAWRSTLRWTHILIATLVGLYVYSPAGGNPLFADAVRLMLFPLAALSGIAMWQLGPISRALK